MMRHAGCIGVAVATLFLSCAAPGQEVDNPSVLKLDRIPSSPAFAGQTRAPAAKASEFEVEVLVGGLTSPWALGFLPDGMMLINEYGGTMRLVAADGSLSGPIAGLPEISTEGWAGLFDLAIHPDFAENGWVYFSYTAPSGNSDAPNIPRVARARLDTAGLRLNDLEVIVDGEGQQELHFAPDGSLFLSGAGSDGDGQDPNSYSGKLLRLNEDGSVPHDNPIVGDARRPSAIYSLGHRDVSGIATHPVNGEIWMTEHGPRGGDELNRISAGANYGWPLVSYGTEYTGDPIGDGKTSDVRFDEPVYFWRPSIAPSGLMFYSGDEFPEWRGDLFVTALSGQHIARLVMQGDKIVAEERLLLQHGKRVRELRQGPDGALYVLTNEESDGPPGTAELLRISR